MAMVQTNQKVSFLPFHTNRDAEALLVRLHEVDDGAKLAKATFELIDVCIPNRFVILLFRPLEFELPCRFFPVKWKPLVDEYMAETHKHDIWLRRSPVNPQVTVVRHSDYTPQSMLHQSIFSTRSCCFPASASMGPPLSPGEIRRGWQR